MATPSPHDCRAVPSEAIYAQIINPQLSTCPQDGAANQIIMGRHTLVSRREVLCLSFGKAQMNSGDKQET